LLSKKPISENCRDGILQSILYAKHDCITLIWDEHDEVLLVTKPIEDYFEIDMKDIMHETWDYIFPNHLVEHIKNHFKKTSQKMHIPQQLMSSNDSKLTYFSITIEKVETEKNAIFVCTMHDVTENQELVNTLNRVEKQLLTSQMSANIVHEIRNPLTAIKGFLQLIEAGIEYREQYVEVLLSEVEKIEGLTNELLQMANPNNDKKKFIQINELITDVLLLMKAQTRLRKILFEVSGELDVSIFCNPHEIKQVLINLILNAADAMHGEGTIKINVERRGNSVVIQVIDHGQGMSEQALEKVNDEFYTTKQHGTGLGLVVTEQIIEKHCGQLSIFSKENEGSTFEVTLPI